MPEFPRAAAMRDCSPSDGPAVSIVLTRDTVPGSAETQPFLRIGISRSIEQVQRERFQISESDFQITSVQWCESDTSCATATGGHIRIGELGADSVLDGELDVQWLDGRRIAGSFQANWSDRRIGCF